MSVLFATAAEVVKEARINALLWPPALKDEKPPTAATNLTTASCGAEGDEGGCFVPRMGIIPTSAGIMNTKLNLDCQFTLTGMPERALIAESTVCWLTVESINTFLTDVDSVSGTGSLDFSSSSFADSGLCISR